MSQSNNETDNNSGNNNPETSSNRGQYWLLAIILIGFIVMTFVPFKPPAKEISQQQFFQELMPTQDVERIIVVNKAYVEVYLKLDRLQDPKYKSMAEIEVERYGPKIPTLPFYDRLSWNALRKSKTNKKNYLKPPAMDTRYEQRADWQAGFFTYILPILIIVGIWVFIMRRLSGGMGGAGGQIFNFGKSRAALFDGEGRVNLTFDDVAGLDEAKEEVREVVEFLRNPEKYQSLGGKIPKGVLLIGPPDGQNALGQSYVRRGKSTIF